MKRSADLRSVTRAFGLTGEYLGGEVYGSGHIHDSFVTTIREGTRTVRYLHQRINRDIFPDYRKLMENIRQVTEHIRPDHLPETLRLVPAADGEAWHADRDGQIWRTYHFVEGGVSHDVVDDPGLAREAARAFGAFQRGLAELDPSSLHETIPRFHHLRSRLDQLEDAARTDREGRAASAASLLDFARARRGLGEVRGLPRRVVHNDCKVNNVLIARGTLEAMCVVDLDTVMPGLALCDFGDMVRTMTCPVPEDEKDLGKVEADLDLFGAVAEGYLSEARHFLTPAEVESLGPAGPYMTLVIGVRFLTDYLSGDVYFKTHRPGQNLDRCRSQFALVESLEAQAAEMSRILRSLSAA
jgi:Ser/Thr protein kinase RdoA (MazF antagonist)